MGMHMLVSVCCALFGLFVTINETKNIKKLSSISIINLFGYMYGITYGFFPAITLFLYQKEGLALTHGHHEIDYSSNGVEQIAIWLVLSIVGYIALRSSYNLFLSKKFRDVKQKAIESNSLELTEEMSASRRRMFGKLQVAMLICFVISMVSLYLWLRAYGGIFGLISIADKVRDGNAQISNSMAFFMRPAKMIMIVFYMSLILVRNKYKTGLNLIFLCISLVSSFLMLLGLDGRMALGMFLVIVLLLAKDFLRVGSFSWKKIRNLLIIGVLAMIVMMSMDSFTFYIRNGYWNNSLQSDSPLESVLLEFSYIITGAQHAIPQWLNGECPYLIGHDILGGLFAWVPSSLRPDGIINIWDYNTAMCTIGSYIYGQLPCDFITTSIYALGAIGPLIFGIFWGGVIKAVDYFHFKGNNPISDIFYYAMTMRMFRLVNYCLLYDFVLGLFDIFVAVIIWQVCKHIKLAES